MTNNKIRIAIAEKCGWEPLPEGHFHPDNPIGQTPPDYPNDLNAVQSVVLTLEVGHDGSQADDYEQCLFELVNPGVHWSRENLYDVAYLWNFINATARQRCEALLRTWGLWKD